MAYLPQLLISQATDGTALTASITATSILHATGKYQFQPNALQVGSVLIAEAQGRVSNIVTTPGTLTLELRMASGATVIASGGAMALNTTAKTNVPWKLRWVLTCRAAGTTGNFMHQGSWISESVVGSAAPAAGGAGTHLLPNAAPAVGSNIDTSAAQTLDLYATWSLNNANSIQVHQFQLWGLNLAIL